MLYKLYSIDCMYVCTISMHVRTYVHVCVLDTVYWVYLSTVYSIRYLRGTEERGLILGSVDEIIQSLEDNAMNLQSMAASRFVQPFFDRVQKWEKSLSHISEVVDVRESVFVHTHVQYVGGLSALCSIEGHACTHSLYPYTYTADVHLHRSTIHVCKSTLILHV